MKSNKCLAIIQVHTEQIKNARKKQLNLVNPLKRTGTLYPLARLHSASHTRTAALTTNAALFQLTAFGLTLFAVRAKILCTLLSPAHMHYICKLGPSTVM